MNEPTCPVCFEPCLIEYDADGKPVYTCVNKHRLEEFDMAGFVEEFTEPEFDY